MKIKIYIQSLTKSHIIYLNDKERDCIFIDSKKSCFDVDRFKFLITNMSLNWPERLEDNSVIDGLNYKITIRDGDIHKEFVFKNKFPDNIYKLNQIIDEICEEFRND